MTTRKRTSDPKLERAVVGACLRDGASFKRCSKIIRRAEVFHAHAHQCCWRAMQKLEHEGQPIDAPTLHDKLAKMKCLDDVGDAYIVELWEAAPSASVEHHAKTLLDLFLKRQALEWLGKLGEQLEDAGEAPVPVLETAKADLDKLTALAFAGDDGPDDERGRGFRPFPIEHLPSSLQEFVLAAAEALYCDPAFVAVPALVAIGAAIGNSRVAVLKETWQEPSVFWAAIIADSSSLKSPSLDIAIAPLWAIQRELSKAYEDDIQYWKRAHEDWQEARFKRRKEQPGTDIIDRAPEKPVPSKLLVNDITIERLAQVLWQNPAGVCLVRDELSGWFASFGRYAEGKGPGADLPLWLEIFRAKSLLIDRKGGDPPSLYIPRAACSVVGTIQPRILARILCDDFFDSGLASRLLLCMPPRKAKVWTENVVPQSQYDSYTNIIRELYLGGLEILSEGQKAPKPILLSKAGKAAWIEFYSQWADRQSSATEEHAFALAKLEAYCARFALLLSCYAKADYPGRREEITEGHVKGAFGLVNWFAHEAERVYRMVREPVQKQTQERLVEFIRAVGGSITARRLMRSNPSKYPTSDAASKQLESLAERGLATWKAIPSEETKGPPTRTLVLNPTD